MSGFERFENRVTFRRFWWIGALALAGVLG